MIQRRAIAFCLASLLTAGPVLSDPKSEPHLTITPRTAEDAARVAKVTAAPTRFDIAQPFEANAGGAATVPAIATDQVFSQPSKTIPFEQKLDFEVGKGLFRKLWVSAPSSTLASDGLGPLFNARSCMRCHIKNGRGHPPERADDNAISFLLRVSIPGTPDDAIAEIKDYIATRPEPTYGGQLQDLSLPNHPAEYDLTVNYTETAVALSGGETVSLRAPRYGVDNLGYGPLHPDTMFSPRVAPQMIGMGLLEAIPAADILALADPNDADGDGISGRANIVWSAEYDRPMLGRFGHKAGTPTMREQSAGALVADIGISTPIFPAAWGECTSSQTRCRTAPHGDGDVRGFELDDEGLDFVTFYSRNLGVPARRDVAAPNVLRGKQVFHATGCAACHQPSFVTHRLPDQPEQSFQLIWPYSDMLLHDMGPGLADNRPEARATGREWRTPPLWGIGLTSQVSGHTNFLHDGRARSLLEAILWHGGEAQAQRDAVVTMPPADRAALITFLESL